MVVVAIIGILASTVLFAMLAGRESAREQKTKALISEAQHIVMAKYEPYRTRRVPIKFRPVCSRGGGADRLDTLHDIMRQELPDHWIDVSNGPIALLYPGTANTQTISTPAISQAYHGRLQRGRCQCIDNLSGRRMPVLHHPRCDRHAGRPRTIQREQHRRRG